MKNILTYALILAFSTSVLASNPNSPLNDLRATLGNNLISTSEKMSLGALKTLADERNTDMDIAYENYLIAKKRVWVARAAFNPLTTGHALGIALGFTYLWAPIAIEAVLSIPTKIYNVSSNKYLAKAGLYNSKEARSAINNELAHLYYDILTHEVILKSIDREIEIYQYQIAQIEAASTTRKDKVDYNKATILSLKMERVDIYNLYKEEMAALKTMLVLNPSENLDFAQNNMKLTESFLSNLDLQKLQDFSLVSSNKYKTKLNLTHAAESNVKSVEWSILSFNGINFSYKSRVRSSKIERGISELNQESAKLSITNEVLLSKEKLESAINIYESYNQISNNSLSFFEDNFELFNNGVKPEEYAIESSIGAIRDFRSNVIAHYASLSSLDDFSKSTTFSFVANNENDNAQKQIENNMYYDIAPKDFKVVQYGNMNSADIRLVTKKTDAVESVKYKIIGHGVLKSSSDKHNFEVTISSGENSRIEDVSGTATVTLKNGHEFNLEF